MLHGSATALRVDRSTAGVWLRTAICGRDSRSVWLERADRDLFLLRYGAPWLASYYATAEYALASWALLTPTTGPVH